MELKLLLALLPLLSPAAAETVLGAYIFHRHGDRTTKSWPPTSLTALGADQVHISGNYYRNRWIAANASNQVNTMQTDIALLSQMSVTAPIDTVLQNSAQVFLQGLYPPAGDAAVQTLANGTDTEAPLGGYQYIPVNAVSNAASSGNAEDSEWLQAGSGCGNAVVSSNDYFKSAEYLGTLERTTDFYHNLLPVINTTFSEDKASFKNGYTIYDYVHVSMIHNATIPSLPLLTDEVLFQLQTLADQHEWGLAYNESEPVRAIGGSVLAAQILQSLNTTITASVTKKSAQKIGIQFGAYATFMSFFGLANLTAASDNFKGVVDYASSIAFELVTNTSLDSVTGAIDPADVSVRFLFSNGSASDANPPQEFPLFGQSETLLPYNTFVSEMTKFSIGDTASWCKACGNSTGVCASSTDSGSGSTATGTASSDDNGGGSGGVSKPVAGVIGALVTLVVILAIEGLVMAIAGLRLVKKRSQAAAAANNGPLTSEAKD